MKKKVFSKSMAWVLSVMMVLGMLIVGNVSAIKVNASSYLTLAQLKQKFPAGKYWNHAGSTENNPDGYTDTPCTHHGNCSKNGTDYSGWCGCNGFGLSIQCMGFANKLAYDAFGSLYTSWPSSNSLDNLKAGDVIRYKNNGHSIFVTNVSGDTITYGDCNSDGHCKIRWDATTSKSIVASTLTAVYFSPSELTVEGNPSPIPIPDPSFPGAEDTSYDVPKQLTAQQACNTYDANGNMESSHWVSQNDSCYVEHVYTNGFCWVKYPTKSGDRWAYTKASIFEIPKKSNPLPDPDPPPVIVDDSHIKANVEVISGGDNCVYVRGWAYDEDDPSASIFVHVYIGGVVGDENAEGHAIMADKSRVDVNNAFGCGNNHGFEDVVFTDKVGVQSVYLYGIDVGPGSYNPSIGYGSANITDPSKNLGDYFCAYIIQASSGKVIAESNDNVVLQTKSDSTNQQWFFERQDDNSYQIKNRATGKCIDVANAGTEFGTNIQTWNDNDSIAQRWFVTRRADRHSIRSALSYNLSMDVAGGSTADGTNIHLWEFNTTDAQTFMIRQINVDTESPVVFNQTLSRVSKNGYRVTCNFSDNVGVTRVLFPTWTDKNGQDDLINYEGIISGNTATVYINTSEHNNETGVYYTHIYAYDAEGNVGVEGVGISIHNDDEPYPIKSVDYNEHRYTMILADMSWTEAQAWCEKQGGYLATVTSQEEWDTIKWLVAHNNAPCCWLGAESTGGSWKWVTGEEFAYTDWLPGEPNCTENREFYLGTYEGTLINAYKWNDFSEESDLIGCFVMEDPLTYTISYDLNGGEGSIESQKKNQDETLILTSVIPTKQGFEFLGWSTDKEASFAEYAAGAEYGKNGNVTLYAVWKENPLTNTSNISSNAIKLGTTLTVTASATGGTGDYTYAVYYKKSSSTSWMKVQDYSTNSKVKIKPAKAVKYDVLVKVKDSSGKIAKKTFTVNVVEALKNNSTVSSGNIGFGDTVTIKAKATGGVGPYSYAVYYKKASSEKWSALQKYSDNTTVTFKPASATTYDVMVKVQDSRGVIVKKTFTVNVTKPENTSELSADTVKLGNAVTVSCSAKGGSGYYQYAVLYKKTSSEKWTTKQNYSSTSTVSIKPAAKATYDICVKVKDSLGNIAKKYFTLTVTK